MNTQRTIILFLFLFISSYGFSQKSGTIIETLNYDTSNDHRKLSYVRKLDIRYDEEFGKYYNSLYLVYENGNNKVLEIAISNYKSVGKVAIYIMPCNNGKIVEDLIQYYLIKSSDFKNLEYIENYEKENSRKKVYISYISNKKEHLKLFEIDSKTFNLHYKIIYQIENMEKGNSILDETIKENFYITLYFDTKKGFKNAGIKRAYLDFSRTLFKKGETDEQRKIKREKTENHLISELNTLLNTQITTQKEFDIEHKRIVFNLIEYWNKLSIGQSQKWINMTLKYWLLFGENRIKNIEKYAKFFHIPIDSYVQKGMFKEKNPKPWSKINDYEKYMEYQNKHRDKKTGNYPIIDEFLFFNEYKTNKG